MSDGYKPNQPLDPFVMLGDATARVTNDLRTRPWQARAEKSEPNDDDRKQKDGGGDQVGDEEKIPRPKRPAKDVHQVPPFVRVLQRSLEMEFMTRREFSAMWPRPKGRVAPDRARTKPRGKRE